MANTKKKSVFETLNGINVNKFTEKKNGLTYLSWAWAWSKVKENYPNSTYTVYENEHGMIYHTDNRSAWVKTGVTIEGEEHIEYLPIMNYSNKSLSMDKLTSVEVNKAIQRSLTKAIARHGLGLYIYAGEDLPQDEVVAKQEELASKVSSKTPSKTKPAASDRLPLKKGDENWDNVMNFVRDNKAQGVKKLTDLIAKKYVVSASVKTSVTNLVTAKK